MELVYSISLISFLLSLLVCSSEYCCSAIRATYIRETFNSSSIVKHHHSKPKTLPAPGHQLLYNSDQQLKPTRSRGIFSYALCLFCLSPLLVSSLNKASSFVPTLGNTQRSQRSPKRRSNPSSHSQEWMGPFVPAWREPVGHGGSFPT